MLLHLLPILNLLYVVIWNLAGSSDIQVYINIFK